MNICFFRGKIISNTNFKFVMKNEFSLANGHNSICYFKVLLDNGSIINVKTYNDIADFSYKDLKVGDVIYVCGRLTQKCEIEIFEYRKEENQ